MLAPWGSFAHFFLFLHSYVVYNCQWMHSRSVWVVQSVLSFLIQNFKRFALKPVKNIATDTKATRDVFIVVTIRLYWTRSPKLVRWKWEGSVKCWDFRNAHQHNSSFREAWSIKQADDSQPIISESTTNLHWGVANSRSHSYEQVPFWGGKSMKTCP